MQKSTAYYLQVNYKLLKFKYSSSFNGVPERIRTSDTRLRRAVLYPAELLKQNKAIRLMEYPFYRTEYHNEVRI